MIKYLKIIIITGFIILLVFGITLQYSRAWHRGFILDPMFRIQTEEKIIALTFDDGPSEQKTVQLLDLLDEMNVKATFFMLGSNIEKYGEVAQAVFDNGHLIGNHSFSHNRMIFRSSGFIKNEINKTDSLIKKLGQSRVAYFRPPYSSKYLLLPYILRKQDKVLVTGTYDPPAEYKQPYDGDQVARQVIQNTMPGSIIYMHDGTNIDTDEFIKSVELIISELRSRGYRFVKIDNYE